MSFMKKAALILACSACLASTPLAQQAPKPAQPAKPAPPAQPAPEKPKSATVVTPGLPEAAAPEEVTTLVRSWLDALNGLDGSATQTAKFVALYTPDAAHEVGVPQKPLGPEFLAAPEGIRKMAEEFGKLYAEAAYRLETFTADEKGMELLYIAQRAGGGRAIAVPYTGAYTVRATKRRFFYPGVAVFQVNGAGKITHVRFYQDREELAEVRP